MRALDLASWPLVAVVAAFLAAALVIAVAGTHLARRADRLADITGVGEALFGAVLLGGITSLPGIVTSVSTAWQGFPQLAASNAIGGIAVQTAFLAVADMAYRKANLEHAAASLENLMQGALLSTLLAIPILAMAGPEVTLFSVHPATAFLVAAYLFGLRVIAHAREDQLWKPKATAETQHDQVRQERPDRRTLVSLWVGFAALAVTVGLAGYVVAQAGIAISQRTGLSESVVGALLTAVATSLPELVTSVAAVRHGALTLAVGGIIGGNSFDVLFLAFSDVAYRDGSLYHAIGDGQLFIMALTLLLTGVLLLGLLRREKRGLANIGFESVLVLALYLGGFGTLFFMG
jgi:cation:H+ antiporter